MAAARAGGILANSTIFKKIFLLENIEIQNSLIEISVKKKN